MATVNDLQFPEGNHRVSVEHEGKRLTYALPATMPFIKHSEGMLAPRFFFDVVDYRAPKRGEFYVSGAVPEAYRAPSDGIRSMFLIVTPTDKAKQVTTWVREGK